MLHAFNFDGRLLAANARISIFVRIYLYSLAIFHIRYNYSTGLYGETLILSRDGHMGREKICKPRRAMSFRQLAEE